MADPRYQRESADRFAAWSARTGNAVRTTGIEPGGSLAEWHRMRPPLYARDVMTRDVVTLGPDTPVREIARVLLERRISAAPVLDEDGRVIGMVSEGDLLHRIETGTEHRGSWWLSLIAAQEQLAAMFVKSHGRHASDVMTHKVISVAEETPLAEIAALFERHRIKRVPVLRDGRLVGIVSRANLLQGLTGTKPVAGNGCPIDDRTIRKRIMEALRDQPWASTTGVNIVVIDGMVDIWGLVESARARDAYTVLAEEIAGENRVRNHCAVAHIPMTA